MSIKTRFAPSPTGHLHIGGARTALFNWLYARHNKGKFVLRIEDSDQQRSQQQYTEAIIAAMDWLGLDYDEGPYYQSQRLDKYQQKIAQLLATGNAYRCTVSQQELEKKREQQLKNKQKPRYDGKCRDMQIGSDCGQPFVVRFKNPLTGEVRINDQVKGEVVIDNSELDDLVIARNDGSPTYNLTVVVDDAEMAITDVIRGDDHLNNTPRQINMYRALNSQVPQFAHVPMILGNDGKRLSKRHGATSVLQYKEDGYLPQALLNYLLRLGWSCGDREIFSRQQMIELFNLEAINQSPAAFDAQKLLWLNHHYIKELPIDELAAEFKPYAAEHKLTIASQPQLGKVLSAVRERCKTLKELVEQVRPFYADFTDYEPTAIKQLSAASAAPLAKLFTAFGAENDWQGAALLQIVKQTAQDMQLGMGKVGMPLRAALCGSTASPSLDITLELLGKQRTMARIERALNFIDKKAQK